MRLMPVLPFLGNDRADCRVESVAGRRWYWSRAGGSTAVRGGSRCAGDGETVLAVLRYALCNYAVSGK